MGRHLKPEVLLPNAQPIYFSNESLGSFSIIIVLSKSYLLPSTVIGFTAFFLGAFFSLPHHIQFKALLVSPA